jgi:hypothetical protein
MYDRSDVTCYDKLRLTKRNFHDLCAILWERCGLRDSVYVSVEEKVAMFLLVVGHGLKLRLLRSDYKRSLETISRHFSDVLTAILSLSVEFIKLPDPSIQPPDYYNGSGLAMHLEHWMGVMLMCVCMWLTKEGIGTESNGSALTW